MRQGASYGPWSSDVGASGAHVGSEDWRRHFEQRAQWAGDDAVVSAWSREGFLARVTTFRALLPRLATRAGLRVLDLGCGAGTYTRLLADAGHQVTAVDYALAMARRARVGSPHARFVVADGGRAPFRAASFDLILCIGVLQCTEAPGEFVAEAGRLLRPGGRLVLESLNPRYFALPGLWLAELARRRGPSGLVRHSPGVVRRSLEAAGLSVRDRVPIYVRHTGRLWPVGAVVGACSRLPGLAPVGAMAFWWNATRG